MFKNVHATLKYTKSESVSTIAVINGLAITVGSTPTLLAPIGKIHPISFEKITAITSVMEITIAISNPTRSKIMHFAKYDDKITG